MTSLALEQVYPNRMNPNIMDSEEKTLLKKAVENDEYDPIVVSPMRIFYPEELVQRLHFEADIDKSYIICDGEYRYQCAVELGLDSINCEVWKMPEAEAMPYFYQRQKIRGRIDPFREAALFRYEQITNGKSRKEIAEIYNVNGENYVKTRLKLLNVADNVLKLFYNPPPHLPGKLTYSHLRDLVVMPKRQQKKLAMLVLEKNWSTRDLQAEMRRVKEEQGTRAETAWVPAPKEQPKAKPKTRQYKRPPMEKREELRKPEPEPELKVELQPRDLEKPLILDVRSITPLLKIVLQEADAEGLDLSTKDPIDGKLVEELKEANIDFFEMGHQVALPIIVLKAMQLYVRSEIDWDGEDEDS